MRLNASSVIPRFTCWYSGVARYLAKASSQSAADKGGSAPTIGCHSVIERPACDNRVMPPTTMTAKTSTQQTSSQAAIARSDDDGRTGAAGRAWRRKGETVDIDRILPDRRPCPANLGAIGRSRRIAG